MKTCAFTGHRPNSFPWKYDETARDCVLLKKSWPDRLMPWWARA